MKITLGSNPKGYFLDQRIIPEKIWNARYSPNALSTGAALAAGPEERRSCMVLYSSARTVNSAPPIKLVFKADIGSAKPDI